MTISKHTLTWVAVPVAGMLLVLAVLALWGFAGVQRFTSSVAPEPLSDGVVLRADAAVRTAESALARASKALAAAETASSPTAIALATDSAKAATQALAAASATASSALELARERQQSPSMAELGQAGDIFGGANAMFAAFAFVGVAIAASFQFQSTQLAQKQHNQQSFEPLFFLVLNRLTFPAQLEDPINQPILSNSDPYLRSTINSIFNRSIKMIGDEIVPVPEKVKKDLLDNKGYLTNNGTVLGIYFRAIYQIFDLIEHSNNPGELKRRYANIVRSGVGNTHLFAIGWAVAVGEAPYLKKAIEKYGFFKDCSLHVQLLLGIFFEKSAFLGYGARTEFYKTKGLDVDEIDISARDAAEEAPVRA